MPRPVFILVHPGSLAAHGGSDAIEDVVREFERHDGPLVVIDGLLSDKLAPFEDRLGRALEAAEAKGEIALRLWGCDSGEPPFPGWRGYASSGAAVDLVHADQEEAAGRIAPLLRSRDAVLTGAWATHDDSSGCVNSVSRAMRASGWPGRHTISDSALFEEKC